MRLTTNSIRGLAIPKGKSEKIHFDDDVPGFGYRLRGHAPPTWVFQYKRRDSAQQRRVTLGRVSAMGIHVARKEAEKLYAQVKLGEDPVAARQDEAIAAAETFKAAVDEYLHWQRTRKRKNGSTGLKPRSMVEIERHLNVQAKPLHKLPLKNVTAIDVRSCVAAIYRNSGPRAGNAVRGSIGSLFAWAIKNAKASANPVVGSHREDETRRDRVLLPAELRAIWAALADDQYGEIVRVLLLTMQRRDEIGGLRRSELHGETIVLPAARTKNGLAHVVPLSPSARKIVERQPLRSGADGNIRNLIFGSGEGQFSGWSKAKTRLDERIAKARGKPLPGWRLHDLRRSAATYISGGLPADLLAQLSPADKKLAEGLKVAPHVREAILNHISGYRAGVSGVYDTSTYEDDKRKALNKWALRLMEIVEGSNVTPMRGVA